jgi:UDP-glucose 4-epimerase
MTDADDAPELRAAYTGRRALVTGGAGFVGSNLARRLVALGADVVLMDALLPDHGGNPFNLDGIRDRVRVEVADVRDRSAMDRLIRGQDFLFNLAGQVSHIDSMHDPFGDLETNCRSQLSILESCRHNNQDVAIVFAASRQQYGRPQYLPVDERHPIEPVDVNGINKTAGESYHRVYAETYGLRTVSLRLTNTYGPRQLVRHNRQGFIGWFIRTVVEGGTIDVYGDGAQVRDLNHVDDVVDAFLRAGVAAGRCGRVYNLAGDEPIALRALAEMLVRIAGRGALRCVPWPPEKRRIDIGSYYGTHALVTAELGWRPRIALADGLERTVRWYERHLAHYV